MDRPPLPELSTSRCSPPHETWLQAHFGAGWNNPAVSGDSIDCDKDGLSNLLEYTLGSLSNDSDVAVASRDSTDSGKLEIAFTRNSAASGIIVSVMASDDLNSRWSEIARSTAGAVFTGTAPGATVNETGGGLVKDVRAIDIHLVTNPAHPNHYMCLDVTR